MIAHLLEKRRGRLDLDAAVHGAAVQFQVVSHVLGHGLPGPRTVADDGATRQQRRHTWVSAADPDRQT